MLFNSHAFILAFLPATLVAFFAAARVSELAGRAVLLAASFFFYAWWSVEYGLLIVATIVINYGFGRTIQRLAIDKGQVARHLLIVALAVNLGLLGYYKYRNFFIENLGAALGFDWSLAPLILPLAISFHTFQQIAYLVDSYRQKVEQPTLFSYALFVLFFPQLIAGPIVHHWQLLPQLHGRRMYRFNAESFAAGLTYFVLGLGKKVLLADPLSSVADPIFDAATAIPPTATEAAVATLAYTFGLYFDFSGYSDMAVGLALMFGVRLPFNFNSPYQATSIIEFWRRWHITLSHWLRDYLYIPLGGSRHGPVRRHVNLLITMLLGGLWHGAAWSFVLWGALHGAFLIVNHAWNGLTARLAARRPVVLPPALAWALTFGGVALAWIFFRSPSLDHALAMLNGLVGSNGLHSDRLASAIGPGKGFTLALAAAIALLMPNTQQLIDGIGRSRLMPHLRWSPGRIWSAGLAALFMLAFTQMSAVREFVYFQF
ncbi:MAG: MBOAT family O-acyltransferase [Pseudomonadota bacterium]